MKSAAGRAARNGSLPIVASVGLLLLLPALVLSRNSNVIFSAIGTIDPWLYYGFFRNLVLFKRELFHGTYYGSRLPWLLPGYLANLLFQPLAANYVLHLAVYYVAVLSLYYVLSNTVNRATALLTAVVFGLNPYVWYAVGWDYPDGIAIAYYLLTMAILTFAAKQARPRFSLFLAGVCAAAMFYCNVLWLIFFPVFLCYSLFQRKTHSGLNFRTELVRHILWLGSGALVLTVALGSVNYFLEGSFWFYRPSLDVFLSLGRHNPFKFQGLQWIRPAAGWLLFPALTLLASVIFAIQYWLNRNPDTPRAAIFFATNFVITLGFFALAEGMGQPTLELHYYASLLLPCTFLANGALMWRIADAWPPGRFLPLAGIVAVVFSLTIWDVGHIWRTAIALSVIPIAALTAVAVLWRMLRSASTPALSVLLAVQAVCLGMVPVSAEKFMLPRWEKGTEQSHAFLRVNDALTAIDAAAKGRFIRFWYSDQDPNYTDFRSLNSLYLFAYSLLGQHFPLTPAEAVFQTGSILVVPSSDPQAVSIATKALASRHLIGTPISNSLISRGDVRYSLGIFRVATDPQSMEPLSLSTDGLLSPTPVALPLPAGNWKTSGPNAKVLVTQEGLQVTTPSERWGYAAYYALVSASADGEYLFRLRHRALAGRIEFAALKQDWSASVGQSFAPECDGADCVSEFTVHLKAKEAVWLQVSNNPFLDNRRSIVVIKELSAFVLIPSVLPVQR